MTVHIKPGAVIILKKIWLALLLLFTIQIVGSQGDSKVVTFNLNDKSIEKVFTDFGEIVTRLRGGTYGDGHYALARESGFYEEEEVLVRRLGPMFWIKVGVLVGEENRESSLYFRGDTLYLVATANEGGNIFYMGNDQYLHKSFKDGRSTGFSEQYSDLLGKDAALAHSTVIATYKGEPGQEVDMKLAVATFTLMILEAQRIKPIAAIVKEYWINSRYVPKEDVKLVRAWGMSSYGRCDQPKVWSAKIKNAFMGTRIKTDADIEQILDLVSGETATNRTVTLHGQTPRPVSKRLILLHFNIL